MVAGAEGSATGSQIASGENATVTGSQAVSGAGSVVVGGQAVQLGRDATAAGQDAAVADVAVVPPTREGWWARLRERGVVTTLAIIVTAIAGVIAADRRVGPLGGLEALEPGPAAGGDAAGRAGMAGVGWPGPAGPANSCRAMARTRPARGGSNPRSARRCSATTCGEIPVVLAMVTGCGTGDREIFVTAWRRIKSRAARVWVVPPSSPQ